MSKLKIVSVLTGVALFAMPFAAFAATVPFVHFQNGDVTISGTGGQTVQATFQVNIPTNQVVEYIQTQVTSPVVLAPVCTAVGGELGLQEGTQNVTINVQLPPNTNTYDLSVKTAGIYGGIRSVDCNDNQNGSATFSNALRVVADASASTVNGNSTAPAPAPWEAAINALAAQLANLANIVAHPPVAPTAPAPTITAVCQAYNAANSGTVANVYNSSNVALQGFLLSQHMSIPALAAGASFGFYGNQTTSAVGVFNSINHCNI
jgi:hypothetical protein